MENDATYVDAYILFHDAYFPLVLLMIWLVEP
jgi:hypothetical protein